VIRTNTASRQWPKTGTDEQIRRDQENKEDKTLYSRSPTPANFQEERFQQQRKDYTTKGASCRSNPYSIGTFGEEKVADSSDGRCDDQRRASSTEYTEDNKALPVLCTLLGMEPNCDTLGE
jgi:hypothetical protein